MQPPIRPADPPGQILLERRLAWVSCLSVAFIFVVIFWPLFEGRLFFYGDLGNFHIQMRLFYAWCLRTGESFLWFPMIFCGYPLHAEGQVGMYHPVHWLLYRVLPLPAAFALECALAYPFAFLGMTLFLRRLRVPAAAAVCGGASLGLSTYLLIRYTHVNVVAILAHIPWILLLVDIAARSRRARVRGTCGLGIALLTGSQLLLGYPGAVVVSVVYAGLYALYLAADTRNFRPLAGLALASAVGLLIGAVQWLPTFELFQLSIREDLALDRRIYQSLHPWNLLQLLSPYLFRHRGFQVGYPNVIEQSFYLGAAFPIAATWLVVRRRRLGRVRVLVGGLAVACAVSLVLALGKYGGLYPLFAEIPLLGQQRVPARFALLLHFAAPIVIALAFADLLKAANGPGERKQRAGWLWLMPAVSAGVALLVLAVSRLSAEPGALVESFRSPGLVLMGPLLSAACAGLWYAAARGRRAALAGIVLFVAADQGAYGATLWWVEPPQTVEEFRQSVPRLPPEPGGRLALNYYGGYSIDADDNVTYTTPTRYVIHGARLAWGYAGLPPKRSLAPFDPTSLRISAVKRVQQEGSWVDVPDPLPRFRLLTRARTSDDPWNRSIDVGTTAIVEQPVWLELGPPGSVVLREERPGLLRLSVEAPGRQLLVISESYHPGWQLSIDGAAASVLRVYRDFMGAAVGPDDRELVFEFRPRSLEIGEGMSTLGLLFVAAGAVRLRVMRSDTTAQR